PGCASSKAVGTWRRSTIGADGARRLASSGSVINSFYWEGGSIAVRVSLPAQRNQICVTHPSSLQPWSRIYRTPRAFRCRSVGKALERHGNHSHQTHTPCETSPSILAIYT